MAVLEKPVVRNGEVVVKPMVNLMMTIDHRFIDGHRGMNIANKIREELESPWLLDGLGEAPYNEGVALEMR